MVNLGQKKKKINKLIAKWAKLNIKELTEKEMHVTDKTQNIQEDAQPHS